MRPVTRRSRSIEALDAQAESQRFSLEATYLTLTSNLAGAEVQEASLRGQIAATLSIIKIETEVLDLLRRQREFGSVADALRAIQADAVALQKAAAFERAAFKSLDIVRHRLELGDINYLALFN